MKQLWMGALWLGIALVPLGAQDIPGGRDRQPKKEADQATGTWEVRVYLTDKDKKDVDPKDITATLVFEDKAATRKTLPMQLVTPKPDEKTAAAHEGQVREVEGGMYFAEMVVFKAPMTKPAEPPKGKEGKETPREPGAQEKGFEEWMKTHTHTGPYFKADVGQDVVSKGSFMASVTFRIKGETKAAKGFEYPFMAAKPTSDGPSMFREDLKLVETQINAGDWTKASATADRLYQACRIHEVKDQCPLCNSYSQDLKNAVDAKDKDKSLDAARKLRTHCEVAHPEETKPGGTRYQEEKKGKEEPRRR